MRAGRTQLIACACASAIVGSPALAAADERVSLADLLVAAARRSPNMSIARADRAEGRDRIAAAGAIDEWRLIGRITGQDSATPRELAGPGTALATQSVGGELGLSRNFSTGGDVTVAVATSQVDYLYPTGATGTPQTAQSNGVLQVGGTISTVRLTASQPLLRGRGGDAARADQKQQQLAGRSLAAAGDDEAAALVRDLVFAYWELAYATEAIAVDKEGEELATRQVAITQEVVRAGMQPPSANKQAELQVALRREAILRDDTTRFDQSLAVRRLAGLELDDAPLAPGDPADVPAADRVEGDVVAAALAHGPGLAQKLLAQRGATISVDAADNAALPRVDVTLTGEVSGVGTSSFDAAGHIGDGQMYSIMGGLTVQWDLGGAAHAAAAGARVHRARLDAERASLDTELESAAMSATHALARARARVELSETAVDVAVEALRADIVAFQAGRATTVSVFQRQDELSAARLRLARARVDAIEADVQIDYLTGSLLARYGVTVDARKASS